MVSPDSAVRRLMRDTGKLLQPYGFDGAEPSWARIVPGGVARVGRTRATRTWTDGQQLLRFGLTLSATPLAWWEFRNWCAERLLQPPIPLDEATGPGLIPDGLAADVTELWCLRTDPEQQGHAQSGDIEAIRAQLPRRVHAYARRALQLLEPDRYLDELLALPDPHPHIWAAIAILLTAHGPTPQLDNAIAHLRLSGTTASPHAEDVIAYVAARTALV
ncbi:hypothetical protein [Nocardia sp. NPDC052566]|uniref:hypothetical protein n=1 Tax=Nocardia sp. NPDC052566 TaxID=3364330 RepID=UPI0037C84A68